MASFKQRQIVLVKFKLPGGASLEHPVIILSNDSVIQKEKAFVGVMMSSSGRYDEYTFKVENNMLSKPPRLQTQIRCHLVALIDNNEVINPISEIKKDSFTKLLTHINKVVFIHP